MTRCTSTSSLDELLSLHCEEEIEFQHHSNSSTTTFMQKDEETKPRTRHRHYKSKFEHRHRRRHKQNTDGVKTKITQEINVEKQEFRCTINLNTTVRGHSYEVNVQNDKSPKTVKSVRLLERPVPQCQRQVCKPRHYNTRCPRPSQEQHKKNLPEKTSNLSRTHRCRKRYQEQEEKSTHSYHTRNSRKHFNETVSWKYYHSKPVNSTQEEQYDEISNKSLDIYLEIPTSYKNAIKTSKDEHQQSKLDTLIKRAKERERKLVQESRNVISHTSAYTEAWSEESMPCSELEASLHSRSTLVLDQIHRECHEDSIENLRRTDEVTIDYDNSYKIKTEPQETQQQIVPHNGYSPSIGFSTKKCLKYSPSSICNDWKPPYNMLNIKEEPAVYDMDIDVYSPTQNPDLRIEVDTPEKIKIKIET